MVSLLSHLKTIKKNNLNGAEYQLGIGIHSCESAQTVIVQDDECLLILMLPA